MMFTAEVAAGNEPNAIAEGMIDTIESVVEKGVTEEEELFVFMLS